jgi:hypothetical protein
MLYAIACIEERAHDALENALFYPCLGKIQNYWCISTIVDGIIPELNCGCYGYFSKVG